MVAVIALFVMVTASHIASLKAGSSGEELASSINISGRQRMLSQRILFFASEVVKSQGNEEDNRKFLSDAIDLFETSHQALTQGGALGLSGTLSPKLRALYFATGEKPALDTLTKRFISDARAIAESNGDVSEIAFKDMRTVGPDLLLKQLNEAVSGFEEMARDSVQKTREMANLAYWLAVLVLLLESIIIFYPAHRSIMASFGRLESTLARLEESELSAQKNAELAQTAQIEAEIAAESKAMFLANMSHEIRTPLNAVIGFAGLALRTALTTRQRDYITKIKSSSSVLLALVNDILDVTKIDADQIELESIPFKLDDVLNTTSDVLSARAAEKGLELLFRTDPGIPLDLVGDPLRLGQVLTNLIGNAVKFTDEGEVVLDLKADHVTEESVELTCSVKDSGIGMTEDQISKLFRPFTQADASTTRRFGGTGLGLTITKRLVELMDGRIWVTSVPDEGSIFSFTVRLDRSASGDSFGFIAPEEMRESRILVVDDNEMALQILTETLESMSFKVTAVTSGYAAINEIQRSQEAREEPYKIAFIDWKMPGINGIETTEEINNMRVAAKPQIVMLTAFDVEEMKEEALKVGAVGFMTKPVNQSRLFNQISETLHEKQSANPKRVQRSGFEALKGAHLLIAEDNQLNQQVISEVLADADISFELAGNGEIALKTMRLRGHEFDGVLMDIQMPVMDGFDATRQIRSIEAFKETPIIAMTAHTMTGDKEKCLTAGMNDHVAKPLDPDQMFATLAKWIDVPEDRKLASTNKTDDDDPETLPDAVEEPNLPEVEGLDTDAGLKTLMGNKNSYLDLLKGLHSQFADAGDVVSDMLENGRLEEAARTAHSLKGVSGNLGAVALYKVATDLEQAIKDLDIDSAMPDITPFVGTLQTFMDDLGAFFEKEDAANKKKKVEKVELQPLLVTPGPDTLRLFSVIKQQLEEGSTAAEDTLAQLKVRKDSDQELISTVASLIDDLEFDEAAEKVAAYQERFS